MNFRFWEKWGLGEDRDLMAENKSLKKQLKRANEEVDSLQLSLEKEREELGGRISEARENWERQAAAADIKSGTLQQKIRELEEQCAVQKVLIENLNEVTVRDRERIKAETAVHLARQRHLRNAETFPGSIDSGDS